ncbi:hypothetical protein C8A03DRAFT_33392 [Achaetomium macrosporum]|uniref:Uncharacterized protein n=1 Tax=Achaetomium macrosporum TaxID=79813 RepID=A0AAN7HEB0_9PEZI|nr:hypothetical protein C8A03DRAFT_33392 [Achaetomium macrosporum]
MAPGVSRVPVDRLRAQILENCAFFSEPQARFWLIVSKEPLDDCLKAIVVRAVDGNREAVLSEKAPCYLDALQALFVKSAEAVQNYIATNGFAFVSSIGKQTPVHTGSHDSSDESDTDSSSTVTLSESECESLSDDETVSVSSVGRLKKRSKRKAGKPAKTTSSAKPKSRQPRSRARSPSVSAGRSRSRSSSSSSSDEELHYGPPTLPSPHVLPKRASLLVLPRPFPKPSWPPTALSAAAGHPPPPPPPPQAVSAGGNQTSGSGTTPACPPPPPFITLNPPVATRTSEPIPCPPHPAGRHINIDPPPSTGTGQAGNVVHHPTNICPLRDVILEIHWRGHGVHRVLHRMSQITLTGIRDAALADVRRQPSTWNVPGVDSPHHLRSVLQGLRATAKAMVVDGMEYGLTRWAGDDLTRLIGALCTTHNSPASGGGLPKLAKFEVEVWSDDGGTFGHGRTVTTFPTTPSPLRKMGSPTAEPNPPPAPLAVNGPGVFAPGSMHPPPPGGLTDWYGSSRG